MSDVFNSPHGVMGRVYIRYYFVSNSCKSECITDFLNINPDISWNLGDEAVNGWGEGLNFKRSEMYWSKDIKVENSDDEMIFKENIRNCSIEVCSLIDSVVENVDKNIYRCLELVLSDVYYMYYNIDREFLSKLIELNIDFNISVGFPGR